MAPDVRSIQLSSGPSLQYVEQGGPGGVPVILLHGYTDSWRSFEPVLPHLPQSIRTFALTLRGHGDTGDKAAGYRFHDFAGDVVAFMDALDLERAVIVGHSMGSVVAQRLAIDHPQRILGLVLVGSFTSMPKHPELRGMWDEVVSNLTDPIDPEFVREFQQSTVAQPVPEAHMEIVVRESLKVPARVWKAAFAGFLEDDLSPELKQIKAPTLILWGDQDGLCSYDDQKALTAAIAGSQLMAYEGAGHGLHWEEPERFARDLAAFVGGIRG